MASAAGTATSKWSSVGSTFQNIGSKISNVGGSLTKGITLPAVGAAGAVGGITAALGWGRLRSIDSANAQLKGLGYSAKDVENISGQVATALEGGMMTLGEGTRVAAGGLAAGVEQGKELEKYIGLVDAAAIGMNTSVDETAMIFNRVQGSGKVMTEELQMVEQRMPGFSNALQEHIGVASDDEFKKMVTAGEVGSDAFLETMDTFAGDMAKEHAKSFDGLVDLAKAYVGQIGEAMLGGVFEQSKDSIAEFVDWLSDPGVQAKAAELGKTIGDVFSKVLGVVKNVITWFMGLPAPIQKTALVIGGIAVAAGPVLLVLGTMASTIGTLITTFGAIAGVIAKIPAPLNILGGLFRMISPLLGLLKVGLMAVGGAMKALWLTMMANPIVLIIAAVVAIVAALVWFFTQTETGKKMWSAFMDWLGQAWEWIKTTAVTVFNAVVTAITTAWQWIKDTSVAIWNGFISWIVGLWNGIIGTAKAVFLGIGTAIITAWNWIKTKTSDVWNAIINWIKDTWNKIITTISDAVNKVKNWISDAWTMIKTMTAKLWNGIKMAIARAIVSAVRTVQNKVQQIKNWITNTWNRVKNTTSNAWSGIKSAVRNGINGAVNFVRRLPGRALSALGNIGSKLYNSGKAMIDGFKDGIVNAFNNAVNAVKNGLSRIRNFFPFSPAKEGPFSGKGWTWYSGQSMSEGLADGMASGTSDVVRQSEALMKAAAFDAPSIPGMTRPSSSASGLDEDTGPTSNINFHITNPVAEPTSETARKASAYIGVSI